MSKIAIGILGVRRGLVHLRNFLRIEEARVIGVADRDPACRQKAAERFAECGVSDACIVEEYEDLLALKPDAICVASNGRMQAEHSIQALRAGCHVVSEVPGAFTLDEWIRLRAAVEQTGKIYMLAENSAFLDFLRYWRKWNIEGRFGPISIAEGEYLHYLPETLVRPDFSRCSPSAAKARGIADAVPIWRADQPPIQYLTHDLGPLLEVLDDRCVSVSCRGAAWRCPEAPLRSDGQIALFETVKGALIKIMVTLNTRRPSAHNYRLFGVEGSAEWYSHEKYCRLFAAGRDLKEGWERIDIGAAGAGDDPTAGHGGTDLKMARGFARAILNGETVPIDIYRGIEYSLPGIVAAQSAQLGGAPLPIPDLRPKPFEGTRFWDFVGLPE